MTVQKPSGGKTKGIYVLFDEAYYKMLVVESRKEGLNPDQLCEKIIRNHFQCEEWRGT